MAKFRVLYTEDDETIAYLTKDSLEQFYEVIHCPDGRVALDTFKAAPFDICLLDIMMPAMDGFELATCIRRINTEIPIIFISAKTLKEDRIKGLKIGADDYLVKPFSIEELILKIEIFLKRSQRISPPTSPQYTFGRCHFHPDNYTLYCGDKVTQLTQRESELLLYFIQHKNKVLKREDILLAVWGDDDYFMGRSLDVFISRLRKILVPDNSVHIENLHGIGFRFRED